MLWFHQSFFPVVWIAFILYWRIKAADTKASQRVEPNVWPILRALTFLIVIVRSRYLASRCPGSTSSSGRGACGPSGSELLLPSPAFCSPSGRAGTSAATGATP